MKLEDTCSHIIGIHQSNQRYDLWRTAILHPTKLLKCWPNISFANTKTNISANLSWKGTSIIFYSSTLSRHHNHILIGKIVVKLHLEALKKIKSVKYFLTGGSIYLPCRETSNSKYLLAWFINQTVFSRMCFNTYVNQVFETKTIPRYI